MISAIVLTKDNEKTVKRCLECLLWVDELIVIDDYSSDKTVSIARKCKAKVFKRRLIGNFAAQRNFGLTKAKNKWILFIDSDEFVTENLKDEILLKITSDKKINGYRIPRADFWLGRNLKHGENNTKIIRLARKGKGRWKLAVHEVWQINGKLGTLKQKIIHYSHPNISSFISKIGGYSNLHAKQNKKLGKTNSLLRVLVMPLARFVVDYKFKLGFLDGVHGFVTASIMSFHSFLGWSNLWLTSRKKK